MPPVSSNMPDQPLVSYLRKIVDGFYILQVGDMTIIVILLKAKRDATLLD